MKKILTLTKEQGRLLYNLVSQFQIPNRSDNRKRFKFLEVIEDFVFKFEDDLQKIGKKEDKDGKIKKLSLVEVNLEATEMGKKKEKFTFNDREIFSFGKDTFEKSFEKGAKTRGQMGKTESSPLTGRDAKVYVELENAFMDVKEIKGESKKKK